MGKIRNLGQIVKIEHSQLIAVLKLNPQTLYKYYKFYNYASCLKVQVQQLYKVWGQFLPLKV